MIISRDLPDERRLRSYSLAYPPGVIYQYPGDQFWHQLVSPSQERFLLYLHFVPPLFQLPADITALNTAPTHRFAVLTVSSLSVVL